MIEFPTKLNALHPFSHNLADEIDPSKEAQYIADLTAGCVLEITPLIAEILRLCESKSNPEIREALCSGFSDVEISEAYRYLWQLRSAGILFSGNAPRSDEGKTISNTVLVAPGFLYTLGQQSFVTRLVCYQMLRTLCREMELYAPLFVDETDVSLPEDFDWEGVQPFPMPTNSTASYMNQCPVAYGGTLSLPGSGIGDLVISGFASPPAVYYVSSGSFELQSTLDKYFALRDGDRLCVDAWWIKERLSTLIPNPDKIAVVPTGVDSEFFQPMDTGGCKIELASAFQNDSIKDLPLMLLFLPSLNLQNRAFVEKLAGLNPQMCFMVVLCHASEGKEWGLENIEDFPIADLDDYNSLPILFNAAALGFFPATPGNQLLPLVGALCCGVPVIVSGPERLKSTMPSLGSYLPVEGNRTVDETVGALSKLMRKLLKDTDELRGLRERSREIGVTFGWEEMAKSLRDLFTGLMEERSNIPPNPTSAVGFYEYRYDIVTGTVTPSAYERASGIPRDIDELLATDLLAGATSEGVQQVVEFLATDSLAAKKTLERLHSGLPVSGKKTG